MNKRYQVFVSSPYVDLQQERAEVMRALLELDCIPAGMELFPAADDDAWTLIRKVIDDSDYYILILGGRYGSIGPAGISYTHMEYDYALQSGKPIIAFLHADPTQLPVAKTETDSAAREGLETFQTLVRKKLCRTWSSAAELGSVVSRSVIQLMKSRPGVGWIRADAAYSEIVAPEILRLREEIDRLKAELSQATSQAPQGVERLAQGEELFTIRFNCGDFRHKDRNTSLAISWDDIFRQLGPVLYAGGKDILGAVNRLLIPRHKEASQIHKNDSIAGMEVYVDQDDVRVILLQFQALGLVCRGEDSWALTPLGRTRMLQLVAIPANAENKRD
jgi:hypothetical protein